MESPIHGTFRPCHGVARLHGLSLERKSAPQRVKPARLIFHVHSLITSLPEMIPDDDSLTPAGVSFSVPRANGESSCWWPPRFISTSKGSLNLARSQEWRVYANINGKNGRWRKEEESSLSKDEPLSLPMTFPGSTPDHQEVQDMENCEPEKEDCKDVLYQWIGKCLSCQGTGEVSYFRKKGKEIICKCIPCTGLGYVHKITRRKDIEVVDLNGIL